MTGNRCPRHSLREFSSFSESEDVTEERRPQAAARCRWLGTGRAPLLRSEQMLQTLHLLLKQAEAFGRGVPSVPPAPPQPSGRLPPKPPPSACLQQLLGEVAEPAQRLLQRRGAGIWGAGRR